MSRKLRLPKFKKLSSSFNFSTALGLLLISLFIIPGLLHAQSGSVYYPGRTGEWESRRAGNNVKRKPNFKHFKL